MPRYEFGSFDPPAPVIRATIVGQGDGLADSVPMLIDSGSDSSIVPLAVALAVGADILPYTVVMETFTGEKTAYEKADLTIEFLHYRMRGRFLVAPSEYGILGRNVLNRLRLTLDGPRQEWFV